jgi:predicted DCC family thiol-disulfide oxidoreductase YuxK
MDAASAERTDDWLVYDGDCPFCSAYVRHVRLREVVRLTLIDAREGGPEVREIVDAGLDLDEGMVLKIGGRLYHGDECIHALALLSSPSGVFNRFNKVIFSSRWMSRVLYPVLRAGRNLTLRLLGRSKVNLSAEL